MLSSLSLLAPLSTDPQYFRSKQVLLQLFHAAAPSLELGEGRLLALFTDEVVDDLVNEIREPPSTNPSPDSDVADICRLAGISKDKAVKLVAQFRAISTTCAKTDFVSSAFVFHLQEVLASFDLLATILRLSVCKKRAISHPFASAAESLLDRVFSRVGNEEKLFALVVAALNRLRAVDVPQSVAGYSEALSDVLASLWSKYNLLQFTSLLQIANMLQLASKISVSAEDYSSIVFSHFDSNALKMRYYDEASRDIQTIAQRLQLLFSIIMLPFGALLNIHPGSITEESKAVLSLPLKDNDMHRAMLESSPACSFIFAVYAGLADCVDPSRRFSSHLEKTIEAYPDAALLAARHGALPVLTETFKHKWILSTALSTLDRLETLDSVVQGCGHDMLMATLTVFNIVQIGAEIVELQAAVFDGNAELAEVYWMVDANWPERTSVLQKMLADFPLSASMLANALASLCSSPFSAQCIVDLLRRGKNIPTLSLERKSDFGLVDEQYDAASSLFNLKVRPGRRLEGEFYGVKLIVESGATGSMCSDFSEHPMAVWNVPVDGWQFMTRIIKSNVDQSATLSVLRLFKRLISHGHGKALDGISSEIAPVFLESSLPATPSKRCGSLLFALFQCIQSSFSRPSILLSIVSDALGCMTMLLGSSYFDNSLQSFSSGFVCELLLSPDIFDLILSFNGVFDTNRFTVLSSAVDFLTVCVKRFDDNSSIFIRITKAIQAEIIPQVNQFTLPTLLARLEVWASLSRFIVSSRLYSEVFFRHCFQALSSLPGIHAISRHDVLLVLSDIFSGLAETASRIPKSALLSSLSMRFRSDSLLDAVSCEVLKHWSGVSSFWAFLAAVIDYQELFLSMNFLNSLQDIVIASESRCVVSFVGSLISRRPKDFILFKPATIKELITRSASCLKLIYHHPHNYASLIDSDVIRGSDAVWTGLLKAPINVNSLEVMSLEFELLLEQSNTAESKLPAMLSSLKIESLFSADASDEFVCSLCRLIRSVILAENTGLLAGFSDDRNLMSKLYSVCKGRPISVFTCIIQTVDTIIRFGKLHAVPQTDVALDLLAIAASFFVTEKDFIFDLASSLITLLQIVKSPSESDLEIILELLGSATCILAKASSTEQVVSALRLLSATIRLLACFLDAAPHINAEAVLQAVFCYLSPDAFVVLSEMALLSPNVALALAIPSLVNYASNMALGLSKPDEAHASSSRASQLCSFLSFICSLACQAQNNAACLHLLISIIMQFEPSSLLLREGLAWKQCKQNIALYVALASSCASPLVEAFIADQCFPSLNTLVNQMIESTDPNVLVHDALFQHVIKSFASIAINCAPSSNPFKLLARRLFPPSIDNHICVLGLASELQRLVHLLIKKRINLPQVIEPILLMLSALRRSAEYATVPNSMLSELTVLINCHVSPADSSLQPISKLVNSL